MSTCLCPSEGFKIPANEWTKTIECHIDMVRELQNDYQDELTMRKVNSTSSLFR